MELEVNGDVNRVDPEVAEMEEGKLDGKESFQEPPQGILKNVPAPKEMGEPQDVQEEVPSKKDGSGKGLVNHAPFGRP